MKPHGGYKYAWPEDYGDLSRSAARALARREAEDQLASALSQAELDLIACDAGACPHGCGGAR